MFQRADLQKSAGRDADQDFGCARWNVVPTRRLHREWNWERFPCHLLDEIGFSFALVNCVSWSRCVKVLVEILSSLFQREPFALQFVNRIRQKRNSYASWAKAISSARRRFKGNCSRCTFRRGSQSQPNQFGSTNSVSCYAFRDDLRTANIISDSDEGVTCLVIDRETFNQSISNLDEIRNKYNDEGALERKR